MRIRHGHLFTRLAIAVIAALRDAGVSVETHEMNGWPHGFGADGGWIDQYFAPWLTTVFAR